MRKCFRLLVLGTLWAGMVMTALPAGAADRDVRSVSLPSARDEKAKAFIQKMGNEVIRHIIDTSLSHDEKARRLNGVLKENFDLYTISRFTLGRYWQQLAPAQQDEYRHLFEKLIVTIYSQRFSNYQGQEFRVTGVRPSGERDFIVSSLILQPNDRDIPVGWHIREKDNRFQIVDVTVEDVSMIVTQKADFASIIQRQGGDPAVIIDHLRARLGRETI